MKFYKVSFQYSETVFCSNIAEATNAADVEKHYSKYTWVNIEEATSSEVEAAKRKGMPIIKVEHIEEDENTETTESTETEKKGVNTMKKTYAELINEALEMLKNDDDLFIEMVNELDSWNGYADGFRVYAMDEIDELLSCTRPSDILSQITKDFNYSDDYFYFSIWGLESTDYPAELYREHADEGEVLDEILEHWNNLYFYNEEFEELINEIVNFDSEEADEADALETIAETMKAGFNELAAAATATTPESVKA